ncbi:MULTISPECIES: DUF397 domain-containing protein [unclassified Streptomyces]|uniref:DUF397 domain-containing protein n=1 Tax=Streptomyces salyersiae TaxID=3075530 RepID=A0ABU2RJM3_9ACTN|nr:MULTISPECIES: DUF397 domain-containing protein [unclassified Streptomyces]MYR65869.1 DUF397 domain-containing protein [Streptomyces sp. SID4939]MYS02196.1 DUF397 domain-containing protein [Streptomyces sp. SID4940]MYT63632.1 DUF397 domain-containing protein [Streptomyces sp. SID8357]MYT85882.1 DUF397 domain-containing protein [Streptomyces sp. SID8360]MYW38567.1 DUF397 domain-containing protein [Streptomyces sp. SID1]HBF80816.1 DUF397 domain-containing protein [Streptomyces sp.]
MPHFEFVKSSYSSGNGECVEVARNIPRTVAVRDSKRPGGPHVTVTPAAWDAFTADLRRQP